MILRGLGGFAVQEADVRYCSVGIARDLARDRLSYSGRGGRMRRSDYGRDPRTVEKA